MFIFIYFILTYYICRNFRNRLILELAINVNGLINSIHPNIIQRLNEDEQKELQKYMKGRNVFYSAGLKVSVFEDKALDLQKCEWAKILRD